MIHVFNSALKLRKTVAFESDVNLGKANNERVFVLAIFKKQIAIAKISVETVERKFAFAYRNLCFLDNFIESLDNSPNKLILYAMSVK